jgi:predicted dehydrogenase
MNRLTRRTFVKSAAAAGAWALPAFGIGKAGLAANSKMNIAAIGVGGRGGSNLRACSEENIVALCDVNLNSVKDGIKKYPGAKTFTDFRVMFDTMGNEIDAVNVSTPDHTHFVAAMAAMQNKKHVFVEKPLAHNIWQLRTLHKAAHHYNVVTQMGNQGHATDGIRKIKEWVEAGVLGDVKEVFAWFNGPNFQGHYFSTPDSFPPKAEPVPENLEWDLWLGPAGERPYSRYYEPRHWRGWYEFGNGQLGDWACHTLDAPFWSLNAGMPTIVEAEKCEETHEGFVPAKSIIRFEFPQTPTNPAFPLKWYDGGLQPENRPEWGLKSLPGNGMIMVGTQGTLMTGGRPNDPKLLPDDVWQEFSKNPPEPSIPRVKGGPTAEWLAAIKGDGPMPGSNFDYSTQLTEMTLLGVMAQRFNTRVEWDAKAMKVTNNPRLNTFVKEPVRKGWEYGEEVWKA